MADIPVFHRYHMQFRREQRIEFTVVATNEDEAHRKGRKHLESLESYGEHDCSDDRGELEILDTEDAPTINELLRPTLTVVEELEQRLAAAIDRATVAETDAAEWKRRAAAHGCNTEAGDPDCG